MRRESITMATAVRRLRDRDASTPPFVDGERLDAAEFMRRYEATDLEHIQLIEGVVYMPSPTRVGYHGSPQIHLLNWMGHYYAHTPGTMCSGPATVKLDWRNVPEPDGLLWIDHRLGGQSYVDEAGYLFGSPELGAEIAASSRERDLGPKVQAYQRTGIREYIVWLVKQDAIRWYALRERTYQLLAPDRSGIIKSETFPGLWLDVSAMLRWDLARVFAVLDKGLASRKHAAFVARLKKARKS